MPKYSQHFLHGYWNYGSNISSTSQSFPDFLQCMSIHFWCFPDFQSIGEHVLNVSVVNFQNNPHEVL